MRNLYGIRGINYILKQSIFVIACLVLLSILLILAVPKVFLSIYSVSYCSLLFFLLYSISARPIIRSQFDMLNIVVPYSTVRRLVATPVGSFRSPFLRWWRDSCLSSVIPGPAGILKSLLYVRGKFTGTRSNKFQVLPGLPEDLR